MRATRSRPAPPPCEHTLSRFLRTPWRSRSAARAVDSASLATGVALVRALAAFDPETARALGDRRALLARRRAAARGRRRLRRGHPARRARARRRQARAAGRAAAQGRAARRGRVGARARAPRGRRAHRRGPALEPHAADDRAPPPRAHGRPGLSARPARERDPGGRAHRRRLRRLRGDDAAPPLPRVGDARRRDRRAAPQRRRPVRRGGRRGARVGARLERRGLPPRALARLLGRAPARRARRARASRRAHAAAS